MRGGGERDGRLIQAGWGATPRREPLGNLVDGFLDRQRVAEQMGQGMVGGMMGPNAAMMGQTMMGEVPASSGCSGHRRRAAG